MSDHSSSEHHQHFKVSDNFVIPLDHKGDVRDGCCSKYFEICGGCGGKPIELKVCDYDVVCITVTALFYWCKDERNCKYPPNVNSNVTVYTSEKICDCKDTLGWDFLLYPPECAQALNVCVELVPHRKKHKKCKPCKECHKKKDDCGCSKDH